MNRWQKFLLSTLGLTLVGTVITFAVLLQQTQRELNAYAEREAEYEVRLERLQVQYRQKVAYLEKLERDPEFLERVVRERLGYSRPDDLIYRFPE